MTPRGGYRRRIVDTELDFLIANLFAIAIDGPKAVGKTATAEQRAATVHRLDTDPLDLIEADPSRLTNAPEPILIDEWQHWPPSWDFVRRAVDDDPRPGRFILTGSTSLRNPQTHSGAGRIVSLRMRPLTLPERGEVSPAVSLADLLSEQAGKITGDTAYGLEDYTEQIVGGGFPGMQSLTTAAKAAQLDGYIRRIVERDFPEAGKDVRTTAALHHDPVPGHLGRHLDLRPRARVASHRSEDRPAHRGPQAQPGRPSARSGATRSEREGPADRPARRPCSAPRRAPARRPVRIPGGAQPEGVRAGGGCGGAPLSLIHISERTRL